jgi:pyruvate formate lyase activating enzyme
MVIGGLQKFSLLDYPDNISAIVFTDGCNFRCSFCYNPMLVCRSEAEGKLQNKFSVDKKSSEETKEVQSQVITEKDLFGFLNTRIGKIDAVVVSGGEPTLHADLPEFIQKIKKMGFKVKLDTNGTNPKMLQKLLKNKLLDYIAMDIKASPEKYNKTAAVDVSLSKIKESITIIMSSKLPYEFRTTVVPGFVEISDIDEIGSLIEGADKWFLQQFDSSIDLVDPKLKGLVPHSSRALEKMQKFGSMLVKECKIR